MKNKLTFATGLICLCIGFNLINYKAFAQERYLIVLDIQQFPKKNKQLENSVNEMTENVNALISRFNPGNVIYIKSAGKAISITLKGIKTVVLPAPEFDNNLHVVSNNIFTKTEGDAFTSAELESYLKSRKAKEIVLAGLMAEKCIYNTALGGEARGYQMKIVTESIVGTTQKRKDKAVKKMKEKGIQFIPMTEIVNTL
jgi:nicotinamidase-related amidase